MLWTLASLAVAADSVEDCDADVIVNQALRAVLAGDDLAARAILDRVLPSLACGEPARADTLGRWWVVDGVLLFRSGDVEGANDSFASAAEVAPGLWLPGLGDAERALYDDATLPQDPGRIELSPDPGGRSVWIDGDGSGRTSVSPGLHLVQVGDPDGTTPRFADLIWVGSGLTRQVSTGLPTPPPAIVEPVEVDAVVGTAEVPDPTSAPRLQFHLLAGGRVALGDPLTSTPDGAEEPDIKISVPVEVGVGLGGTAWWLRLQGGVGPLANGTFLSQSAAGEVVAMPYHIDGGVAGGIVVGGVDLGLLAGIQWPSRLTARAVVGFDPVWPLHVEIRPGVNVPTERSPEPAVELLVGLRTR